MSAVSVSRRAVQDVDKGIGTWLTDLVTGAGSSPSHIIVTGILGVIPGVGQAMDVRDLVLGIIAVAKSPAAIGGWVELVITLIGCIPAIGDAFKVGFKLIKEGHSFGRVLEAMSPKLRGNIEQRMRNVDWSMLAAQSKTIFAKSLDAFVDGLDTWVVKAVTGRAEVAQVVGELRALQRRGPQMIDEAFGELKTMHQKMLAHELPKNTAKVTPVKARGAATAAAGTAGTVRREAGAAKAEGKLAKKRTAQEKADKVAPNKTNTSQKKAAKKNKKNRNDGVLGEHITDYYAKHKHPHFVKVNNNGVLIEERSNQHHGIDHLWHKQPLEKLFVVGETKSSIFDSFRLMAALPADLQEAFNALRADEAANPTRNGKPGIFNNTDRDRYADQHVQIDDHENNDAAIRKGVNKPNEETGLPTQMSHLWIRTKLENEEHLIGTGTQLPSLIRQWRRGKISCPYDRWIALVTGRQFTIHRKSKGANHQVQSVLNIPLGILED